MECDQNHMSISYNLEKEVVEFRSKLINAEHK